jgi:hypothetical protein
LLTCCISQKTASCFSSGCVNRTDSMFGLEFV